VLFNNNIFDLNAILLQLFTNIIEFVKGWFN